MVHHIFISTIDTQGKIQERLKRKKGVRGKRGGNLGQELGSSTRSCGAINLVRIDLLGMSGLASTEVTFVVRQREME